jgi:hypothetical protein
MTREEILKDSLLAINDRNIRKNVGDRWDQFNREDSSKAIYDAMRQYASHIAKTALLQHGISENVAHYTVEKLLKDNQ